MSLSVCIGYFWRF